VDENKREKKSEKEKCHVFVCRTGPIIFKNKRDVEQVLVY